MKQTTEQFEVLNHLGQKTGVVLKRGTSLKEDEFMGIVTILVVNPQGEILVTRRHPNKAPGLMWEVTGGGIKAYEEPIVAAQRELQEETGLSLPISAFKQLPTVINDMFYCYQYIVFSTKNYKLDLGKDEVIDYKFLSLADFFSFLKNKEFISYIGERLLSVKDEILTIYQQRMIYIEKDS